MNIEIIRKGKINLPGLQTGMSLIELMIAMVLGLLLTAGAINIFITNKATYRVENALARMQETGRFVVDMMTRDIRMAGFSGCASRGNVIPNVVADNPPPYAFTEENYILGSESTGATTWNPALHADISALANAPSGGSDTLTVQRADHCSASVNGSFAQSDTDIVVHAGYDCEFSEDKVVLITDCEGSDIYQISSDVGANPNVLAHADAKNAGDNVSKNYNEEAQIFPFRSNTFYISGSELDNTQPAVWMAQWNVPAGGGGVGYSAIELASGVEEMHIEYGIDTGAPDEYADVYMDANDIDNDAAVTWDLVRSVRIMLLLRSEDNITIEPRAIAFNGTNHNDGAGGTATDRRLRMVYSGTVSIRNRLP